MAGYFGTAEQRRLQARVEKEAAWIRATPGACNSGRVIGCDDIALFGWDRIEQVLQRDGVIGFRLLPKSEAPALQSWMEARGYRIDFWEPFIGVRDTALRAAASILDRSLPPGLEIGPPPASATGAYMEAIQRLMSENGVAPYSGSLLAGEVEPAVTVTIVDGAGAVLACAFGHRPHNVHSRYREFGYGGAVVVAASHRGLGLGRYVNALLASRVLGDLGGTHFYAFVSADNTPSRAMLESCGLTRDAGLAAAMAVAGDRKFTR